MDKRTDGRTDGLTDKASYRDKMCMHNFVLVGVLTKAYAVSFKIELGRGEVDGFSVKMIVCGSPINRQR